MKTTTGAGIPAARAKAAGPDDRAPEPVAPRARQRLADLAAVLSFVALACLITVRLWRHPGHGVRLNLRDEAFFEWMLAHGARVVTQLDHPFVSAQMNVPDGVNMMANTSVLAISIPLTPLTLLYGPHAAFVVFLIGALVGTATAWYVLLSRVVVGSRPAAWVGALFAGFAPGVVAHANGHPNIVAQFLVPLIIWRMVALRRHDRWLRNGVLLGLLIVVQAFINLEILLLTAIGSAVFVAVVAALRGEVRRDARPFLAGLGVAALVSVLLLGYPLWFQFFGPASYRGLPRYSRGHGADLLSFVAFSQHSLAGNEEGVKGLTLNATEENTFFGWPLVVLVVTLVAWLRRSAVVLGLAVTGLVFAVASLGSRIRYDGRVTDIPAPWALVNHLPVFDSAVPNRWALAVVPAIAVLLALGCDRALVLARRRPGAAIPIRVATVALLGLALLPIAPTPVRSVPLAPTPEFVTSGAWRDYVTGDRTVVPLPLPEASSPDPLRWSAQTGLDMRIPRGYFLGPNDRPDREALFSAPPRPTSDLFSLIGRTGRLPEITARNRAEALDDLRYWRAAVVVLAPHRYADTMRQAMTELTGVPPVFTGGVWVWDVRPLVG